MKTIRRLIYNEVLIAVAFVTLGFLSLFFFFDFVDELQAISKPNALGYHLPQAVVYVALLIPSHLYELLPITVLIGTIVVMARLAQSSEYTILRTSGLGPWRALRTLLMLGLAFVVLTFAIGDYLAPLSDRTAQLLKARFQGVAVTSGNSGAWLREKQGDMSYAVNVAGLERNGGLKGVRIFEFDKRGFVASLTTAAAGRITPDSWTLTQVTRQEYDTSGETRSLAPSDAPAGPPEARVVTSNLAEFKWQTTLTNEMVSVALLMPDRMGTLDLFDYIQHLSANGQATQRYELEFWRKVFYPLSCLVMVVLALPFAYLHFRSAGITSYVFGGVLIGISFFLLNNVFGYIGNLSSWWPWLTAAAPGLIYSAMSLAAFGWLVLRR